MNCSNRRRSRTRQPTRRADDEATTGKPSFPPAARPAMTQRAQSRGDKSHPVSRCSNVRKVRRPPDPHRLRGGLLGGHPPVECRRPFRFTFEPNAEGYTELPVGYMHVRFASVTLVSQRSEPSDDLVERVDSYYVHLRSHGADDAAILRKTRFPGKPPLWIPMPPHRREEGIGRTCALGTAGPLSDFGPCIGRRQ